MKNNEIKVGNEEKKIIDLKKIDKENNLSDLSIKDFLKINKKIKISHLKQNLIDNIFVGLKKTINLSLHPKIRIYKKSRKNKEDIIVSKKNNLVNLSDFEAKIDKNTIDYRNKKNLKNNLSIFEQYFDIYNPPRPISYYLIKKISKNKDFLLKTSLYIILFFISVFLYKTSVLYLVESGYKNIYSLTRLKDINQISRNINNSRFDFILASYLFAPIDLFFNNSYFSYPPVRNLSNLIEGGKYLSKGLDKGIFVYDSLINLVSKKGAENIYYTEFLIDAKPSIKEISFDLENTISIYKKIGDLGSQELNEAFYKAFTKLNELSINIKYIVDNYDRLLDILAYQKEKKYLVVFQNRDEIRPTGGFMGSMGVLSIFKGKVKDFDKKDVYAYEWRIKPYRETPPEGISKITDNFGLRDSNYFIDFKSSSEKIKFFMKKAGVDIDGIIYLNNNIILDYLDLIGPIYFSKINKSIDSSNFNFIMSSLVESKIFKEGSLGTPKQILFDFMKEFYLKLKNEGRYKDYTNIFLDNIKNRDIVFFTFSPKNNSFLNNYGLIGKLDYNYIDFVYPVFTSISGNKSDRYVKRKFIKKTSISRCNIVNDLSILQTHLYTQSDEINHINFFKEFGINDYRDLLNIQGKGTNKQFVRIVLPKDSIIENKNVKVFEGSDYKIVSFYTSVDPGKTSNFNLKYTIKNKNCSDYNFKFYKQSGLKRYDLDIYFKDGETINKTDLKGDFEFRK